MTYELGMPALTHGILPKYGTQVHSDSVQEATAVRVSSPVEHRPQRGQPGWTPTLRKRASSLSALEVAAMAPGDEASDRSLARARGLLLLALVAIAAAFLSPRMRAKPARTFEAHAHRLYPKPFSSVHILATGSAGTTKVTILQSDVAQLQWEKSSGSHDVNQVSVQYNMSDNQLLIHVSYPSYTPSSSRNEVASESFSTNIYLALPDPLDNFSLRGEAASLIWRGPTVRHSLEFDVHFGGMTVFHPIRSRSATIKTGVDNPTGLIAAEKSMWLSEEAKGVIMHSRSTLYLLGFGIASFGISGLFKLPASSREIPAPAIPPRELAILPDPDAQMLLLETGFPLVTASVSTATLSQDWYVDRHYGIVIDAGSSGSRLLIYSWKSSNNPVHNATSLPLIEKAFPDDRKPWSKAIEPGISSLATQRLGTLPTLKSVRKYLKPLLGFAAKSIPRHLHASTPVYLLATAGMRLVPQEAQDRILQYSCETVRKYYRFDLSGGCARQFRIISGEAEGIFGWVAVNYLHGGFEEPRLQRPPPREGSPSTYGFLDMGGASMQIAFEPRESMKMSHEQDLTHFTLRTAGGHNIHHEIFVTSFLGFGVNEARRRYLEGIALEAGFSLATPNPTHPRPSTRSKKSRFTLLPAADETTPAPPLLQDPCLPHNLQIPPDRYTHRLHDPKPTLVGTGDLRRCLALVTPYLRKEAPCSHEPCLFNGVAAPITDFAQHRFIGVSEYYYTPRAVQGGAGAYHFDEFVGNAEGICGSAWEELRGHAGRLDAVEEGRLKLRCFKSAWVLEVLHDGFGIPRQETIGARGGGEAFEPAKELNGFPISWTMGAMLFHVSSTIPPSGGGKGGSGVLARDTPKL